MYLSHTGTLPKNKEDDESIIDLTMFNSEDDESSDPDDCCYHIEKNEHKYLKFSIFITSLIIIN
jgi:hypothetical protein